MKYQISNRHLSNETIQNREMRSPFVTQVMRTLQARVFPVKIKTNFRVKSWSRDMRFMKAGFGGFKPKIPIIPRNPDSASSGRSGGDWQNEMLLLHGDEQDEDKNIFDCYFQVNIIGNPFAPSTFTVLSSPMERFLDFKRKVASTAGLSGIFTTYTYFVTFCNLVM